MVVTLKVFEELEKFGKIDELNVCANLGDHMIGNVYVKYEEEEQVSSFFLFSTDSFSSIFATILECIL